MMFRLRWWGLLSGLLFLCGASEGLMTSLSNRVSRDPTAIEADIRIEDPSHRLGRQESLLLKNLRASLDKWGEWINGKGRLQIRVQVIESGVGRIDGASITNIPIRQDDKQTIVREGAAHKLMTGQAAKAGEPDVLIRISPDYLTQVWMDPHPERRVDPVPKTRVDLVSVFLHELGHAFGINGFRDRTTGETPAGFLSDFDHYVRQEGARYYFKGPHAVQVFGGPIPITSTISSQNFTHYGNSDDSVAQARQGLMNGVAFQMGERYDIGPLDLAILQDLGLPIQQNKSASPVKLN